MHVNSGSTSKQPIQWEVLKKEGNKIFVLSKYVLDKKPYNTANNKSINWSTCSLRTWLNGAFMNNAFTQAERNAVVSTSITSKNANGNNVSTKDKVFLLTVNETQNYLLSNDERIGKTKRGVKESTWTRDRYTGYSYSSTAYAVTFGNSGYSGYTAIKNSNYIRPAMWVNLEANYDWTKCFAKKATQSTTSNQYSAIKNLMAKGEYEKALEKLDKEKYSAEVTELTRECRYQIGCEALRNGDLTNASRYLNLLKRYKYKNSVELLTLIDSLQ